MKEMKFCLIRHHFDSFSAPSGHFVQLTEFAVQLIVCYVSLNCLLSVCLEGNENGRLETFDDISPGVPFLRDFADFREK